MFTDYKHYIATGTKNMYIHTYIFQLLGVHVKPYLSIINNIVTEFITILELIVLGLFTTLLKYWTGYIKLVRARKFDSNDFATLYTNIPHNALKNNIRSLVHEVF